MTRWRPTKLTEAQELALIRDYFDGYLSCVEISEKYGLLGKDTIRRIVRRHGYGLRPRGAHLKRRPREKPPAVLPVAPVYEDSIIRAPTKDMLMGSGRRGRG